ncbi:MAG: hypothetical protein PHQ59_03575 [Candidatus Daviesbacteria bacterium]|nr:hypothetical protein [Candidatus Daviesbacteria bacterium]
MLSKDWIKQNGEKLKNAYSYAVVNNLNVKSKEDVLKILKATDSENANEEYAEVFSKVLQLVGKTLKETIEKRVDEGKL